MSDPWIDKVRKAGELSVYASEATRSGHWGPILEQAIKEFNLLAAAKSLGVKFATSDKPPDPDTGAGANVSFESASGEVSFKALGETFSLKVNGTALAGDTQLVKLAPDSGPQQVMRAFIFVPASPQISTPKGRRLAGDGVKLHIAVHELVHACGLSNADHSKGGDPDIFFGFPQAQAGKTPAEDKLNLGGVYPNVILSPPIAMSAKTVEAIRANWS